MSSIWSVNSLTQRVIRGTLGGCDGARGSVFERTAIHSMSSVRQARVIPLGRDTLKCPQTAAPRNSAERAACWKASVSRKASPSHEPRPVMHRGGEPAPAHGNAGRGATGDECVRPVEIDVSRAEGLPPQSTHKHRDDVSCNLWLCSHQVNKGSAIEHQQVCIGQRHHVC